jgi:CHRD domain
MWRGVEAEVTTFTRQRNAGPVSDYGRRHRMKAFSPRPIVVAIALLGSLIAAVSTALAAEDGNRSNSTSARLSGYNEVHFSGGGGNTLPIPAATLRGAVSTKAKGSFKATIDEPLQLIHYELTYEDLEADVTQAHIHFGQRHTVGGIVVWLCETDGAQHPDPKLRRPVTPQCPGPRSGVVTGTIGPEKVIDVVGQGIAATEFDELVRAIRAGATYTNVHSALFPPGEIRGQNRGQGHRGH